MKWFSRLACPWRSRFEREHRAAYHCENGDVAARFFAFPDAPYLKQIHSCAHIHTCAKLPSGEEMLLAYLLFAKIHRNLR